MAAYPYNTSTWRDLRLAKLSDQPLCEVCIRREVVEPAIVVDHIIAINAGGDPFPPITGLMSLCEPCHSWKTNMEDRPDRKRKLGGMWKGCDVDGNPIDPNDDWYAPRRDYQLGRDVAGAESQVATDNLSVATGWSKTHC